MYRAVSIVLGFSYVYSKLRPCGHSYKGLHSLKAQNVFVLKIERLYKIGYLGYLLLFILALVFYKERSFFLDSAFYLFEMVRANDFAIFHYRYVAIFAEIFPLAARWLHADLKVIAVLFSVSYILFPLICYWLCGIMKKYEYGLVLLLFNIMLVADSFYFITSELSLGVDFLLLLFAFVEYRKGKNIIPTLFVCAILSFFIILSHPMIIFPVSYLLLHQFINRKDLKRETIVGSVLFAILLIIKWLFFVDDYEAKSSSGISKLLTSHYFDLPSHKALLKDMLYKFYWLPVLGGLVFVFLFRRKQWLNPGLFAGYAICYMFLVNITFQDGNTPAFYLENFYLLFGLFVAVPLVLNVLPVANTGRLPMVVLVLLILSSALRVYSFHGRYVQRISWEREYLEANSGEKLLVSSSTVPMDILVYTWATPYEFWLLSTVEQKTTASITINDNIDAISWGANNTKEFLGAWSAYKYTEFPPQYFNFRDTVSGYRIIK